MASTYLTTRRRKKFFETLASTGHVVNSAVAAGVNRVYMYQLRREDKEFAAEWDRALELAVGMFEDEAARRAVHGIDKPVFYQGEQCGVIREYSDTLLTVLLKAHKPDMYRERISTEFTGDVGPTTMFGITFSDPAPSTTSTDKPSEEKP